MHDLHPIDVLERERLAHQCRYRRGGQATAGVCGMQPIADLQPARSDPAHEPATADDRIGGSDGVRHRGMKAKVTVCALIAFSYYRGNQMR